MINLDTDTTPCNDPDSPCIDYKESLVSRLVAVEIQGFKSYAGEVEVRGLEDFTCIIGANGAGKSVVGNAIAFVLGWSKGMKKAQLLKLINEKMKQVSASGQGAQVLLTFQRGQVGFRCGRRLTMSGKCEAILQCSDTQQWQPIEEEALSEHLKSHGIKIDNLQRLFVKQQQQAVKVHDPLVMAEDFEALIGTSGYILSIAQTRQDLSDKTKTSEVLQASLHRTERRRSEISPEVRRCKAYLERQSKFRAQKHNFLGQMQTHLQADMLALQTEDQHACQALSQTAKAAVLTGDESAQARTLLSTAKTDFETHRAAKQAFSDQSHGLALEKSRLEVRLKNARADAKAHSAKAKKSAKRLAELASREYAARTHLAAINESIESLHDQEKKEEAAVEALQISGHDRANLMHLQAQVEKAKMQMESCKSSKAEKQQHLASIFDSISSSRVQIEKDRTHAKLLEAQECQDEESRASAQAKLRALQQYMQRKQCELEALQAEHLQAQVRCQWLRDTAADAGTRHANSCFARFDDACLALAEMSRADKLPGEFFGRLCNIAHVSDADAAAAVNVVAKEAINLATIFVVKNRACAEHVLEYLRRSQIGVATCLIVEEMPNSNTRASGSLPCLEGLVSIGGNEVLRGVLKKLFGKWRLADTRTDAVVYLDNARRMKQPLVNIVTRQGELFKANGEVVSPGKPPSTTDKYELAAYPKPIARSPSVQQSSNGSEATVLKQRLAEAVQHEQTLYRQVAEAAEGMQVLKAELEVGKAAANALSKGAASRARQAEARITNERIRRESHALQKLEGQMTSMNDALEAEDKQHSLCQQACKKAEKAYSRACSKIEGGKELLQAQQALNTFHSQVLQAGARRKQAEHGLKRVQSQKAAVQKAIADVDTKSSSGNEVGELTQQLKAFKERLSGMESRLGEAKAAEHAAQQAVRAAEQCLDQAERKCFKAQKDKALKERALQAVRDRLSASHQSLQAVEKDLKQLEADSPPSSQEGGEDMEVELEEQNDRGAALPPTRTQLRRMLVVTSDSDDDEMPEEGGKLDTSELNALEEELAVEENRLQDMKREVRLEAIKEENALAAELDRIESHLSAAKDEHARLDARLGALEEQRYARFATGVKETNVHLSAIFRKLSGQRGDAYCSHADDNRLAFAQGLEFHVRPDNRAWRPFPALSGGQQALAMLALSFALQAAYPSPLYFFDEIDCMLDSSTAARVAEYIRSQAQGQYLVVSHKPQVYERAQCLIGVYTCNGSSEAVALCCEE